MVESSRVGVGQSIIIQSKLCSVGDVRLLLFYVDGTEG